LRREVIMAQDDFDLAAALRNVHPAGKRRRSGEVEHAHVFRPESRGMSDTDLRKKFDTLLLTSPLRAAKGKLVVPQESRQPSTPEKMEDRDRVVEGSKEWARLRALFWKLGLLRKGDPKEQVHLRRLIQEVSVLRNADLSTPLDFVGLIGKGLTRARLAALEEGTNYEERQELLDTLLGSLDAKCVDLRSLFVLLRQVKRDARREALSHRAEQRYREEMREFAALWKRVEQLARRNRYCCKLRDVALRDLTICQILEQPRLFALRRKRSGPPDQPFLRTAYEGMTRVGVPKDHQKELLRAIGLLPWQEV